jgi:hypothetical protein
MFLGLPENVERCLHNYFVFSDLEGGDLGEGEEHTFRKNIWKCVLWVNCTGKLATMIKFSCIGVV